MVIITSFKSFCVWDSKYWRMRGVRVMTLDRFANGGRRRGECKPTVCCLRDAPRLSVLCQSADLTLVRHVLSRRGVLSSFSAKTWCVYILVYGLSCDNLMEHRNDGGGGGSGGSSSSSKPLHRVKARIVRLLETASSLDVASSGSWSPPSLPPPPPPPPLPQPDLVNRSPSPVLGNNFSNKPPLLALRSLTVAECSPIEETTFGLLDRLGHKLKERSDRVHKVKCIHGIL